MAERYKGLGRSLWAKDEYNVFSPWSNPPAAASVGIHVTGEDMYGNINATVYTSTPEDAPPSRIHDLTLTATEGENPHPYLSWSGSLEPDLSNYYIYRKIEDGIGSPWENIAQLEPQDTTYIDYEIVLPDDESPEVFEVSYMVKARDSQNKFSNPSNLVTTAALWTDKSESVRYSSEFGNANLLPNRIELYQNHPNPFNPATTIRFTLPEESKVVLTVYSITGEYVATLVNREMTKGQHQVSFDASKLASGIYLYRIQAGEFTQVRKMMLIK